jgi:hypothetical protein
VTCPEFNFACGDYSTFPLGIDFLARNDLLLTHE